MPPIRALGPLMVAILLTSSAKAGRPLDGHGTGGLAALGPPRALSRSCPDGEPAFVLRPKYSGSKTIRVMPNGRPQHIEVMPATYMISRGEDRVPTEWEVQRGHELHFADACLTLTARRPLMARDMVPMVVRSDLPAGTLVIGAAAGRRFGEGGAFGRFSFAGFTTLFTVHFALTDRLQWPTLPALSYRLGDDPDLEWVVWAGMHDWGFEIPDDNVPVPFLDPGTTDAQIPDLALAAFIGFGLDIRWWLTPSSSLILTTHSESIAVMTVSEEKRVAPTTWRQKLSVGYSITLPRNLITVSAGVGVEGNWLFDGKPVKLHPQGRRFDFGFSFGSVQNMSLRRVPLISVHLTDWAYLEAHAWAVYSPRLDAVQETYMLGIGGVI